MFLAVNLLFYCTKASFEKNERSSVVKAVDFHQSNPGFESRFISCRSLVASGRGSDQSCSHGLDKYHLWLALFCIAKPLQFQAVVHENQLKGPWKNRICSTTMKLRKSLVKLWRALLFAAENLQLYWVVRFFHSRSSCTTHISADVQRIT